MSTRNCRIHHIFNLNFKFKILVKWRQNDDHNSLSNAPIRIDEGQIETLFSTYDKCDVTVAENELNRQATNYSRNP